MTAFRMTEGEAPAVDLTIARMVEATEFAAYADLLRAAPPEWGCVAEETAAGWLLLAPTIDMLLFNRLIGCGLGTPARRDKLNALLARFRAASLRNYGVQLSPAAAPDGMAEWLTDSGLGIRDRWTKVYRPADNAVATATDLRIEPAGIDQAAIFAEVTVRGFGMPPVISPWIALTVGRPQWHHYLAWSGSDAVGGAALFVHGDVGWLGVASTLPTARRHGAQGALMARRIEDGRALGCRWFVTETGEDSPARPNPSFRNMLRAGFAVAYHRPNFMPTSA